MSLWSEFEQRDPSEYGEELYAFAGMLYPFCRSITGNGVRRTLGMIQERVPLETFEVPTGTPVFDWTVPKEWNIRDAYIKAPNGEKAVDFQNLNLSVLNYSTPVHAAMSLSDLRPHLYTIPERPDWVPYRTSYYKENWGFCLSHNRLLALSEGEYEVCIDSTLENGHLTYGEYYLPGKSRDEVLISCHVCHPSLANDNLSGLAIATRLAQFLTGQELRYSYRFLFVPGTIGAITWLARNRDRTALIRHGLVLTCLGDAADLHYKKSRQGNAVVDRAAAHVLRHYLGSNGILDFSPYGYDERQYCSPGFNLAVGCLMRGLPGTFPEYHTSADNLEFIHPVQLAGSLRASVAILDVLERNRRFRNLSPFGEPQLGRRNLFRTTGGESIGLEANARLWVLNLSDGAHSLLDIAERSAMRFSGICEAASVLEESGLLMAVPEDGTESSG